MADVEIKRFCPKCSKSSVSMEMTTGPTLMYDSNTYRCLCGWEGHRHQLKREIIIIIDLDPED